MGAVIEFLFNLSVWLLLIIAVCYGVKYYLNHRKRTFPLGIVIHHTVTPPYSHGHKIGVADIDLMHKRRNFKIIDPRTGKTWHIGYHFLVQQDGTVLTGRPEYLPGEHTKNHWDMLGIALIGNFEPSDDNHGMMGPSTPPPAQVKATAKLVRLLMNKYNLTEKQLYFHRELGQTACPGRGFQKRSLIHALRREI
jgi:N-acetylmuramoyl-L-alanine amidase